MRKVILKKLCLITFLFISKGYAEEQCKSNISPTIIITCASGELGGAIAKKLANENNLILTGRNIQKLHSLQSELQSHFSMKYEVVLLDYLVSSSIFNLGNYLLARDSEISGLVLITPRPQFCNSLFESEADWLNVFQATFTGPLEALKTILPYAASPSKIVIIAGTTSVQLLPEYGPACVIRRMWTTYAKALSHQLAPEGVYVNTVSPGVVLTDFHVKRIENKARENHVDYDVAVKRDAAKVPLGRHASPEEVAQTVKFLLSKDSDFINGVNLVIDGGATLSY